MKLFLVILRPVWKTWFLLWFVVPFILMFPLFYFGLVTKRFDFVFKLKRLWARIISIGAFIYPVIKYSSKKYKLPKPCVVVCNHTSYLDIIFIPFYTDHTAVFMGKSELLQIPLFKYFFVYLDIPVNRQSIKDSHKAFSVAGEKIDEGLSQIIYPEGTISEHGKLRPFKNGAFKLAIEKQVTIVPVVNVNNWKFLQNGGFLTSNGRPGIPKIVVGDPIYTTGMTEADIPQLKEKVTTFIHSELEKENGK
ncbi:lysophospholipid acyltransferase family protein [Aurantibacillus circumpalustris]|uniref:lysophospholipid acyltransferase family protein n=1 Tax=Aurantibacillus circumpalustris TaxID=3036359 RepID=UPI00295B3BE1|nr:lysophospholipid acyltransferase family protein [Aurantibacillus circumpalustris]